MRFHVMSILRFGGKETTESDLIKWANEKVAFQKLILSPLNKGEKRWQVDQNEQF